MFTVYLLLKNKLKIQTLRWCKGKQPLRAPSVCHPAPASQSQHLNAHWPGKLEASLTEALKIPLSSEHCLTGLGCGHFP